MSLFPSKLLKKQSGFYLLLIVKYERKEINGRKNYANRNQDLMTGEILSLHRLQKVLKLGYSMLGKYALQRRPRV